MSTVVYDPRTWNDPERRRASLVVFVLGAAVLLWAVFVHRGNTGARDATLWQLGGLAVVLLVAQVAILALGGRSRAVAAPRLARDLEEDASASSAGGAGAAASAPTGTLLTLKCGECGTVFDVPDTGQRPLYHTCPGCGAEGMLKGELTPSAPEPAPSASTPGAPPAAKKLKVRCGGCKNVLSIEDTGQRPLRHRCPNCGKLGEIR